MLRQAEQNFCGVEAQWDLGLDSHLIDAQLGFLSEGRPHSHLMDPQLGFFLSEEGQGSARILCEPLRDKPKIPKILRNHISAEVGRDREAAVRKELKLACETTLEKSGLSAPRVMCLACHLCVRVPRVLE